MRVDYTNAILIISFATKVEKVNANAVHRVTVAALFTFYFISFFAKRKLWTLQNWIENSIRSFAHLTMNTKNTCSHTYATYQNRMCGTRMVKFLLYDERCRQWFTAHAYASDGNKRWRKWIPLQIIVIVIVRQYVRLLCAPNVSIEIHFWCFILMSWSFRALMGRMGEFVDAPS